jgi:hypothetical protein
MNNRQEIYTEIDNFNALTKTDPNLKFDKFIQNKINNENKFQNWKYFMKFIVKLNYKSLHLWNLEDDIDKRWEFNS